MNQMTEEEKEAIAKWYADFIGSRPYKPGLKGWDYKEIWNGDHVEQVSK